MRTERDAFPSHDIQCKGGFSSISGALTTVHRPGVVSSLRIYDNPVPNELRTSRWQSHIFGCQVDDKLHIFFDDVVGVSFRTYGYIAHGRVRANRTVHATVNILYSLFLFPQLTRYSTAADKSSFPVSSLVLNTDIDIIIP